MSVRQFDETTTRDLVEMVRLFRAGKLAEARKTPLVQTVTPIYVSNQSGEEIPAYACMKVTGTEEIGDQNYVQVDKPDANFNATFLINGPRAIESDGRGVAQSGPVLRVFTDGGTIMAGETWGPVNAQWYLDSASSEELFRAFGSDDVANDVGRFASIASSGGDLRLFQFTLNEDMASNLAEGDILDMNDVDTLIDADIKDPQTIFDVLGTDDSGLCLRQDGSYYVIQAPCSGSTTVSGGSL